MQETSPKRAHPYRAWLIAFGVPCLLLGLFGFWLGHGEFTESIAKNYLNELPGKFDDLQMSVGFFLIFGIPAGLVGLIIFAVYRLRRRGSPATKH